MLCPTQEPAFYVKVYQRYATGEKQIGTSAPPAAKPVVSSSASAADTHARADTHTLALTATAFAAGALLTFTALRMGKL